MKKVLTVLGARPQFIKASVVSAAIKKHSDMAEILLHTGQHFDSNMSDVFFEELGLQKPTHFLDIHGGSHAQMTARMLVEVERVMLEESPDVVLVYGDTNSTLAGALAAAKLKIPVAHVEAGLRSFNMGMPEEINRILTDRISRWLFTPTDASADHLRREGFRSQQIIPVGDVMFDVALHHGSRVSKDSGILRAAGLTGRKYVLATIHRAENTDDPRRLAAIVDALELVSQTMPVIWPLHPRTRNLLAALNKLDSLSKRIQIVDPLSYLDMVQLEKYAAVIATDSGGVQKEAFFYQVPCVTLRDETEWTELVEAGWNHLVSPTGSEVIVSSILAAVGVVGRNIKPYGDGSAALKIVSRLADDLQA